MNRIRVFESLQRLKTYRPLLNELVVRDLKIKYRRSFLGYVWSLLNPLLMMAIMSLVFSYMFRFDIETFCIASFFCLYVYFFMKILFKMFRE